MCIFIFIVCFRNSSAAVQFSGAPPPVNFLRKNIYNYVGRRYNIIILYSYIHSDLPADFRFEIARREKKKKNVGNYYYLHAFDIIMIIIYRNENARRRRDANFFFFFLLFETPEILIYFIIISHSNTQLYSIVLYYRFRYTVLGVGPNELTRRRVCAYTYNNDVYAQTEIL